MIKYDYLIKRDEGQGEETFKPKDLPRELPNLVLIEGPNSKGKSTLLHILALGCHGLRNDRITSALQDKMMNLISEGNNKLSFSLQISDNQGNHEFTAEKKDLKSGLDGIDIRDANGDIMVSEEFNKKYKLIYDIPENPINRLDEMSQEVESLQGKLAIRTQSLIQELVAVMQDIRSARDPQKIESIKADIEMFKLRIDDFDKRIPLLEEEIQKLQLYTALKFYKDYDDKLKSAEDAYKEIEKESKTIKSITKKTTKQLSGVEEELEQVRADIKKLFDELTLYFISYLTSGKDKGSLKKWNSIEISNELEHPDYSTKLKYLLPEIRRILEEKRLPLSSKEEIKAVSVLTRLIQFLESEDISKFQIPGINMTVAKFIETLKKETKKYESLNEELRGLNNNIDKLDVLKQNREKLERLLPKYIAMRKEADQVGDIVQDDRFDREITRLIRQIKEFKKSRDYYKPDLDKKDISDDNFQEYYHSFVENQDRRSLAQYSEEDLKEKIYDLEKQVENKKNEREKNKFNLEEAQKDLLIHEGKQEHPYTNFFECLQVAVRKTQVIKTKFDAFGKYLAMSKRDGAQNDEPEYQKYYSKLCAYLGERLHVIRHIDGTYEVNKVDPKTKHIYTKCGRKINMLDMGTGQTHSTYLRQLLKSDESKKIIALFDEVAMMDKTSLKDVTEQMKQLYEQKKLLVGVIVQKHDESDSILYKDLRK